MTLASLVKGFFEKVKDTYEAFESVFYKTQSNLASTGSSLSSLDGKNFRDYYENDFYEFKDIASNVSKTYNDLWKGVSDITDLLNGEEKKVYNPVKVRHILKGRNNWFWEDRLDELKAYISETDASFEDYSSVKAELMDSKYLRSERKNFLNKSMTELNDMAKQYASL